MNIPVTHKTWFVINLKYMIESTYIILIIKDDSNNFHFENEHNKDE